MSATHGSEERHYVQNREIGFWYDLIGVLNTPVRDTLPTPLPLAVAVRIGACSVKSYKSRKLLDTWGGFRFDLSKASRQFHDSGYLSVKWGKKNKHFESFC